MKKLFHEKNDDSKKKPSAEEKAFANKETIVGQLEHLSNIGQESFALYGNLWLPLKYPHLPKVDAHQIHHTNVCK